jgi:hypothetical protein
MKYLIYHSKAGVWFKHGMPWTSRLSEADRYSLAQAEGIWESKYGQIITEDEATIVSLLDQ